MPSETGIAVKRGRGRPPKTHDLDLPSRLREMDPLYAELLSDPTRRYTDDELADRMRVTPGMVYALREIAEGRVPPGAMAMIDAFEKMARYGHAPAKGGAKAPDPQSQKSVVFVINVAARAPEQLLAPVTIDVTPQPEERTVALSVTTDASQSN